LTTTGKRDGPHLDGAETAYAGYIAKGVLNVALVEYIEPSLFSEHHPQSLDSFTKSVSFETYEVHQPGDPCRPCLPFRPRASEAVQAVPEASAVHPTEAAAAASGLEDHEEVALGQALLPLP
jgi:hypothetical protein